MTGASDQGQTRWPIRLGHTWGRRADRYGRNRIHEEQLPGPVGQDDDDAVAWLEHAQPAEDHRLPWIPRVTFDDRIAWRAWHRAARVPARVPGVDRQVQYPRSIHANPLDGPVHIEGGDQELQGPRRRDRGLRGADFRAGTDQERHL